MVSSLSGVHQFARLADHLQPTPQRASVVEAIRLEMVVRKERSHRAFNVRRAVATLHSVPVHNALTLEFVASTVAATGGAR